MITLRLVILLYGVFAVGLARSPAADSAAIAPRDWTSRATDFVDTLTKGDFKSAAERFDATMQDALPEAKLKAVWNGLKRQAGEFQRILGTRHSVQGGYQVVLVTCQFDRGVLDAKVVFNAQAQVAGLFFIPSKAPAVATVPADQPPGNIRETAVSVGSEWPLPGTLTMPGTNEGHLQPAVVLVHGSGPNDRDESIGANKPFRDLAWGLAAKGIVVLRYDKRTRIHGAKLQSIHPFTVRDEVIDDVLTAVRLLRTTEGVDPRRIFVLGHSLGGTLAPRIGQADASLGGLIILAGATRKLEDAMVEQTRYLLSLDGDLSRDDEAKITKLNDQADKVRKLQASDAASRSPILGAPPAYWLDLRNYNPVAAATELQIPLLVLQGGRDYQVTTSEFAQWKEALGNKPNATLKLYPKLNHLFIAGEGKGSPRDYERAGHVDDGVIADIAAWIFKMVGSGGP